MLDNCQEQIFIAVLGTLLRMFLVENSQQSGRKGAFEIPALQTRKVKGRSYSWDPREPESRHGGTLPKYTAYSLPQSLPGWVRHQCCGPVLSTKLKSYEI